MTEVGNIGYKWPHFHESSLNRIKPATNARFFIDLNYKMKKEYVKSVLNILCVT